MRFDSIDSLIQFLGVLSTQGYSVPFCDYAEELRNKGMVLHIHHYKVRLLSGENRSLKLVFYDKGISFYTIELLRRD